ncbi:hypothetical protein BKA70DRAFT_450402 [Coprinopsis sp. MPI-PUGE-AT-0042]|nr:hypothetical protein BKA70DRAFT_450402 [Coprinopsis sp. MPI-PUGE-AT-0042]
MSPYDAHQSNSSLSTTQEIQEWFSEQCIEILSGFSPNPSSSSPTSHHSSRSPRRSFSNSHPRCSSASYPEESTLHPIRPLSLCRLSIIIPSTPSAEPEEGSLYKSSLITGMIEECDTLAIELQDEYSVNSCRNDDIGEGDYHYSEERNDDDELGADGWEEEVSNLSALDLDVSCFSQD